MVWRHCTILRPSPEFMRRARLWERRCLWLRSSTRLFITRCRKSRLPTQSPQSSPRSMKFAAMGFTAWRTNIRYCATLRGIAPAEVNIVTMHLGNGASACAIRAGRSVDTSMGFTPLEGLVMGSRSGDLDPALVSYLARKEKVGADEVERWLNQRSGLRGVSGLSNDMRELMAAYEGNPRARLAVEVFCYRARKYLGAYLAVLGGGDGVVFSGGIGENTPAVREKICQDMEWCGLIFDKDKNAAAIGG